MKKLSIFTIIIVSILFQSCKKNCNLDRSDRHVATSISKIDLGSNTEISNIQAPFSLIILEVYEGRFEINYSNNNSIDIYDIPCVISTKEITEDGIINIIFQDEEGDWIYLYNLNLENKSCYMESDCKLLRSFSLESNIVYKINFT